ncbi:MAG: hypothetical protein WCE61_01200 [Candidatus Acidiferrum sp.]|jgi:hypothetical protein
MKTTIQNTILKRLTAVLGLMALLICTTPATSATAADSSQGRAPLIGLWDSQVTLTNCQGVVIKTFEAFEMFNQGGTLSSTDNQSANGPGVGTWQGLGRGSYSAPFQFFSFNPDGTWASTARISRNIQLGMDRNSYTSTVGVEIFDPNGNLVATLCGSEVATRVAN